MFNEEAFAEARNRDPDHEKKWVALVDGNKNQIDILRWTASAKGVDLTIDMTAISQKICPKEYCPGSFTICACTETKKSC
ncbi:MAG: hypothetical protein R6U68_08310 [Desulfobacteraceae bacterium]